MKRSASDLIPSVKADNTRVGTSRPKIEVKIGPRKNPIQKAASALAYTNVGDGVAQGFKAGAELRKGNVKAAAIAGVGAAAATVGVNKAARKSLGSFAKDSRGAKRSAQRIVKEARRPDRDITNYNREVGRKQTMRENYASAQRARDKADLALDYSPRYNERLQVGNRLNEGRATPGIVKEQVDFMNPGRPSKYFSVPLGGGSGYNLSQPSQRVRQLEATAKENEAIAKMRSKKK